MDWQSKWNSYPTKFGATEYLKQVEATTKGRPYSDSEYKNVIEQLTRRLDLRQDDIVLDLCCGNGLATVELAKCCRTVVGIDFSAPLLATATRDHSRSNTIYIQHDVLRLDSLSMDNLPQFSKVLMYGSLQYFRPQELRTLLRSILRLTVERPHIFIGNVPDRERKHQFLNTPRKILLHYRSRLLRQDAMGTWWDKSFIRRVGDGFDLNSEFFVGEAGSDALCSHYRFDVLLTRASKGEVGTARNNDN